MSIISAALFQLTIVRRSWKARTMAASVSASALTKVAPRPLAGVRPTSFRAPRLFGSTTTVDETFTRAIANVLMLIAPFAAYAVAGTKMKPLAQYNRPRAIAAALLAGALVYVLVTMGQFVFQIGPFTERPSLQMSLVQTDEGILVDEVIAGGTAEDAGIEAGDLIDVGTLIGTVGEHEVRSPFRGALQSFIAVDTERVTPRQPIAWLRSD